MDILDFIIKYDKKGKCMDRVCELFKDMSDEDTVKIHFDIMWNFINNWSYDNDIEFDHSSNVQRAMKEELLNSLKDILL